MVRNLTILVLTGCLGSMVFAGSAQACHRSGCGNRRACAAPAPCAAPVACAPRVKKCGFHMPKLCHKRSCAPAPMACNGGGYGGPAEYVTPSAQAGYGTPSAQH